MEMLDKTEHEGMRPGMAFQMVYLGLLDVADVADAQGGLPNGEVECEELAQGRLVVAMKYHKPHDTLQVEGLSGDTFDVWVDNETICFLNDLNQASDGRGVRSAAIPFEDVQNIGFSDLGGGESCIVLSYLKGDVTVEIGFTKASFKNFKQVMMACAQ